jgi:hypothetical protein
MGKYLLHAFLFPLFVPHSYQLHIIWAFPAHADRSNIGETTTGRPTPPVARPGLGTFSSSTYTHYKNKMSHGYMGSPQMWS